MMYFDVFDGEQWTKDEYGVPLDDRSEIPDQAIATAQSLLTDGAPCHGSKMVSVFVRDEQGTILYTAHASSIGNWINSPR